MELYLVTHLRICVLNLSNLSSIFFIYSAKAKPEALQMQGF